MTQELPVACARVQARVPVLVDGELTALEEARDRGHLEACAVCAQALEEHECFLAHIRVAGGIAAEAEAAELTADLRRRLRGWPRLRPARSRRLLAAAVAAGLLCVLRVTSDDAALPRAIGVSNLEPLRQHLPRWSQVVQGLGQLTRWIS